MYIKLTRTIITSGPINLIKEIHSMKLYNFFYVRSFTLHGHRSIFWFLFLYVKWGVGKYEQRTAFLALIDASSGIDLGPCLFRDLSSIFTLNLFVCGSRHLYHLRLLYDYVGCVIAYDVVICLF